MIIEIIPRLGEQPIRIEASQVLIRNNAGTPVAVAGEYGMAGAVIVAQANDDDFNQTLRAFGYGEHDIVCQTVKLNSQAAAVAAANTRK